MRMRSDRFYMDYTIYMVVFPGWQAVWSVFQARAVRHTYQYGPGTSWYQGISGVISIAAVG